LFARIVGDRIEPSETGLFSPICAVCHWLFAEWEEGQDEFDACLSADDGNGPAVVGRCVEAYRSAVDEWRRAIGSQDALARGAVVTYFTSWSEQKGFPAQEVEPLAWCSDACRGMKSFMRAYSLLTIGASGFRGQRLVVDAKGVFHGSDGDELSVVLLWGGGERLPAPMTTSYRASRQGRGDDGHVRETLLVLVQPASRADTEELSSEFNRRDDDIVAGHALDGEEPRGDVVYVPPPVMRWLNADDLIRAVRGAENPAELEARLVGMVRGALA
jgi:hypothetical protein